MTKDETICFKVNEQQYEYVKELSDRMGKSVSETLRVLLYDSRFLYSENVNFGDINIESDTLIDEDSSDTTDQDMLARLNGEQ